VFQIGTASAVNALKVGELVSRDVVGIDLNMGCPKHFSVHAGMGSALLDKPETVSDILKTLVRNLNNPITCKIRLKKTMAETVDLLKTVEQCGIKAVTVHARYVQDRPRDLARWPILKELIDLKPISLPIIANGDVYVYDDVAKCKAATGADSVMIARGASYNVTAAFSEKSLPFEQVMKEYVKVAVDVDQWWSNAKYNLLYMAKDTNQWLAKTEKGRIIHTSKKFEDILAALDLMDYYNNMNKTFESRRTTLGLNKDSEKLTDALQVEVQSDEAEIERVLSRTSAQKSVNNPNVGDSEVKEPPLKKSKVDLDAEEPICGTERF
jgi:tRNA-dihydrouridine synthase 2